MFRRSEPSRFARIGKIRRRATGYRAGRVAVLVATGFLLPQFAVAQFSEAEGPATSGENDSIATAQFLGALPFSSTLSVSGWIDSQNENDVDFFQFEVTAENTIVYLDIDLADDQNSSEDIDDGLDAAVWAFDASQHLIAYNDDADFFGIGIDNESTDPGSDTVGDRDAFVGGMELSPGTYFAAVSWYANEASAISQPSVSFSPLEASGHLVANVSPDSGFETATCRAPGDPTESCSGQYVLDLRTTFVPEPGLAISISLGSLLLATGGRRIRRGSSKANTPRRRPQPVVV